MNGGWDEFSIPKKWPDSSLTICTRTPWRRYFALSLVSSQTKAETVSKTLADNFLIPAANPVILLAVNRNKNAESRVASTGENMRIFYGDSDNDITAARDCGIRGIRILRIAPPTNRCRRQER